jgi:hypothetical protein
VKIILSKILIVFVTLLCVLKASYAFDTGTISGKIIDGFGKPVSSAEIAATSADGAKTKSITNSDGAFSVSYSSGSVKVSFGKEGYVPVFIPLSLEEKTDISVGDITLWKIPPKGGLFMVGANEYTEIVKCEYYSESDSKERRFYVKGSPTAVKGQNIRIIDFQTDNPLVIGKTLYRVDSKNSVGSIMFYPSTKYVLNKEEDVYTKIADNIGLRRLNLPPGNYFYCTGEITIRSKIGNGYFFKVSS